MRCKVLGLLLALAMLLVLIPVSTEGAYVMAISGRSDFLADPYQAQVFEGSDVYFRVYLNEYSPSSLEVNVELEGTLAQYISFPEYNGTPSFTLFPGQSQRVLYRIDFPGSAPGKYTGAIVAIGNPPQSSQEGDVGAIGKPAVAINIVVDVPSEVQIYDFSTYRPGGYPDRQWQHWGDNWTTSFSVVNGGQTTFDGTCNLTLSNSTDLLEWEVFNITNLSAAASVNFTRDWADGLTLGEDYLVRAIIYADTGEKKEEEMLAFRIPTPADIISVEHQPSPVFSEDTVAVYAVAASTDSDLTLHYRVDNGSEENTPMTYSPASGEYSATIPPQAIGSTVYYWVTSVNGQFSDRSPDTGAYSYYVFSPDVPDLTVNENSILFTPIDPFAQQMNETDTTVIYVTVRNIGRGAATDIALRVYDGETPIWNGTVASLAGDGGSDVLHFSWSPLEGQHILRFAVDPDDTIVELNENNNHYTLDPITIRPAPPPPEPEPESGPLGLIPFILIPVLLVLILLLLLRRKKGVNVLVAEVKAFKSPRDGTMRWKYTCSYGDGQILGSTKSTNIHAEEGSVIKVKPTGMHDTEDGKLAWDSAEVLMVAEDQELDTEERLRKLLP